MIETRGTFPHFEYIERFDKSRWRAFFIEGGVAVVTQCGQNYFKKHPEIKTLLSDYKREIAGNVNNSNPTRRWLKSGGNSDVYTVGDSPVVIKEQSTSQSILSSLDRMDYLYDICQSLVPDFISVPPVYAAVSSSSLRRQYLIMQKINAGLTVEDIINGDYDNELKRDVYDAFNLAKNILDKAISQYNVNNGRPSNLLPDWHQGNVIVDLTEKTAEMPFKLSVIDQ